MIRRLRMVLLMGLFASLLAGCGGGTSFAKNVDAALAQVPGVLSSHTEYNNNAGMSKRINVRITASPGAELGTVLENSLLAFADASGNIKGSIAVTYYVFPEDAEESGIRPDAVGLKVTPAVDAIREYAESRR